MKKSFISIIIGLAAAVMINTSCTKESILDAREQEGVIQSKKPVVIVSTIAGTGEPGYRDGEALQAQFSYPTGIATNSRGNLYITERHSLRRLTPLGEVSTLLGCGFECFMGVYDPSGVVVDEEGTVYFANYLTIDRLTATQIWSKFPERGSIRGAAGITLDKRGNLIVAEPGKQRIRQISPDGKVSIIAGKDSTIGYIDGKIDVARFSYPSDVAVDSVGNIFVVDPLNARIRKISCDHRIVSTFAGNGSIASVDGKGADASFDYPAGITIDHQGNLYVTEAARIRKVSPSGVVTTIAGTGELGFADGIASKAKFNGPVGITVGADGSLYVADRENHRIRKISFK